MEKSFVHSPTLAFLLQSRLWSKPFEVSWIERAPGVGAYLWSEPLHNPTHRIRMLHNHAPIEPITHRLYVPSSVLIVDLDRDRWLQYRAEVEALGIPILERPDSPHWAALVPNDPEKIHQFWLRMIGKESIYWTAFDVSVQPLEATP